MRFAHVALNCADPAAAIAYYTAHFGFAVTRRLPIGGGQEIIFLARDDVHLEIFPVVGPPGQPDKDGPTAAGTLRHMAFQVDDVDATIAAMGADAVITLGPINFDAFIPGWRTAWLKDPNGHVVEITQGYRD
jgi:glyoxylase I family protein